MPLAFTDSPATVGEASRPLAAPFWAGSAPRTPTKSDADADADADYISRGAGRSPSSLSPIPEETSGGKPATAPARAPAEPRRLSPTYEAGTPPPAAGAAAAGRADAGAATNILRKATVFRGGGARVRSVRRRAGTTGDAAS